MRNKMGDGYKWRNCCYLNNVNTTMFIDEKIRPSKLQLPSCMELAFLLSYNKFSLIKAFDASPGVWSYIYTYKTYCENVE